MSIASEIIRIKNNIESAYSAAQAKGATMPTSKNSENLANTINSIECGSSDTSIQYIPREIDETNTLRCPPKPYNHIISCADVGDSALYYAFYKSTFISSISFPNLTKITGSNGMSYCFSNCTTLKSASFDKLETIHCGMRYTFEACSSLNSISFPNLKDIRDASCGYLCYNCTNLEDISFPSLQDVGLAGLYYGFSGCSKLKTAEFNGIEMLIGSQAFDSCFMYCKNLTNVSFNNLKQIGKLTESMCSAHFSRAFKDCTSLKTLTFPKLEKIYCNGSTNAYGTFYGNNNLEKIYFPKVDTIGYNTASTSQYARLGYDNMFALCTSLTEIHFSAENESAIRTSPGFETRWGAPNATIYFDL